MKTLPKLLLFMFLIYFNDLKSQALPDLWIDDIESNSHLYQPGHPIYKTYRLHNSGTANCPYSYTAYYLSTDSIKDNSDLLLAYDYANPLKAGDYANSGYYYYYSFSTPYSTAYGNYYLLFVSDFNMIVQEQSETNNVSNYPITIGPVNADLVMQVLTPSPLLMVAGQSKSVKFGMENSGASTVRADYLCVLSDDTVWSANDIEINSNNYNYYSLAQNSSAVFNTDIVIPANKSPGSYYLLYIVDYTNFVNETDESNNIKYFPLTIVSQNADLDIISENVRPSTISSGGNCTISFDLANNGTTGIARGSTEVFFYISKDTIFDEGDIVFYYAYSGNATHVALNDTNLVHVSIIKTIATSIAPGNYYMLMIVDPFNFINETTNANNTGYYPITIIPTTPQLNDVAVLSGNVTGAVMASGRTIAVTSSVYIPATTPGYSNYINYILSTDTLVDNSDISIGGESVYHSSSDTIFMTSQETLPQNITGGQYYVIFDMGTIANDPVPQNNRKFQAVIIQSPDYDLTLNPKEISSTLLSPGIQLTLSIEAYSHSVGQISSFQMAYYLSDDRILDTTDLHLTNVYSYPHSFYPYDKDTTEISSSGGIPTNAGYGSKYILCQIDYNNYWQEINENNNICFFSVNIVQPDVDLSFFDPFPSTHTIDYPTYIRWNENIINTGSTPAAPTYISYYLSTDSVFDNADQYVSSRLLSTVNAHGNLSSPQSLWPGNMMPSGDFYLISYLDKYNNLAETNENNNISILKFQQASPPPANIDLNLNTPILNNNADILGAPVRITCKIQNDGISLTGSVKTSYYLSTDSIYSANDAFLTDASIYNIYPSGSGILFNNLTFPYATLPGNYFILVITDPQNLIPETNENNNQRAVAYTILSRTIDYTINSPLVIPASIIAGQSANPFYNIEKSGNSIWNYTNNPQVTFILSTDSLLSSNDLNLGYGSSYQSSMIIPSTVATGNYYILLIVDFGNYTVETNENNNIAWFPVSIQQKPKDIDFVIGSATAPVIAKAGDQILFTYSVNNLGTTPVYTAIETGFYLSTDSIWGEADVFLTRIQPSYYQTNTYLQIPVQTAPGNYYILFFADYRSKVGETNEFNNTKAIPITIALSDIDLTVLAPVIFPDTLKINSQTNISFAIKNLGSTASPAFSSTCYLSKDTINGYSDDEIGRTYSATITENDSSIQSGLIYIGDEISPGAYYILIIANQYNDYYNNSPQHNFIESNESNNILALPIIIKGADIDLTFRDLQTPITTAITGSSIPFSFKAVNQGSDRSRPVYMKTYLSKDSILGPHDSDIGGGSQSINQIDANSSITKTSNLSIWSNCSGNYYILLQADNYNQSAETNENNNIAWYPISIVNPGEDSTQTNVDLAIQSANSDASVTAGSPFNAGATIINQGMSTANSVFLEYYLSRDSILNSSDRLLSDSYFNSINANGFQTKNQQIYLSALTDTGNYYLLLRVDCYNTYDRNWANNFKAIPIHVAKPAKPANQITDLSITGHLTGSGSIYPGSVVGLASKVNNFDTDSTIYISTYYLSSDLYLDNYRDIKLLPNYYHLIHGLDSVNANLSLHFPMNVKPGNYFIIANIASNYPIIDSDSSNNIQFIPVTVTASNNDLSIPTVVLSLDTIHNNSAMAFTNVLNGGLSASYQTNMAYFLSGDASLSSDDVYLKDIPLKTIFSMDDTIIQQSVLLPAYIVNGNYYLLNYADYLNQVVETNEYNNINSVKVNIIRTGIQTNEENFNFLIIYPNPTTGKFTIKLDTDKKNSGEIFIYNELGLLVKKESIINHSGDVSIDLKNLTKGIYIVQYISDEGIFTSKVLFQ